MGDREPAEEGGYRAFPAIRDFLRFVESEYGDVVTGFPAPDNLSGYTDSRSYWCISRGVSDGNIEAWLLARRALTVRSLECDDLDTEHGEIFILIDQLRDPDAFFAGIPRSEVGVQMPPAEYVRDLLLKERGGL